MFFAMMRPAEVTSLTKDGCHLPEDGWGRLTFSDSSPAAGREFTDVGQVHDDRGLKDATARAHARTRAARARRATRNVPIPPELVALLREHIERFGTGPGGRLFRSENGNPIQPSTYGRVWQKTRTLALTPQQLAGPRCCAAPTTCATPGSPGGSTPASRPPRSPPGPGTASRC